MKDVAREAEHISDFALKEERLGRNEKEKNRFP